MPDAAKPQEPSPAGQGTYLAGLLNHLIADYTGKRKSARMASYCIRFGLIVLGGITTILLGLREFSALAGLDQSIGIVTLILSSLVTMITAWEGFSNTGWRWAHYRTMLARLYLIRDQFDFAAYGLTEEQAAPLRQKTFDEITKLLSEANRAWDEQRFPNIKSGG